MDAWQDDEQQGVDVTSSSTAMNDERSSIIAMDQSGQSIHQFELEPRSSMVLQILILRSNQIKTIDSLQACGQHLKWLDVSRNQLTSLPKDGSYWSSFPCLKMLNISWNKINHWKTFLPLKEAVDLIYLQVDHNPVAAQQREHFRLFLVNQFSGLQAIDQYIVTDEERIKNAGTRGYHCHHIMNVP